MQDVGASAAARCSQAARRQYPCFQQLAALACDGRGSPKSSSNSSCLVKVTERGEFAVWGETESLCGLREAVCELAGVSTSTAQELVDLGAVYIGERIKGQDLTKWRRAVDLLAAADTAAGAAGAEAGGGATGVAGFQKRSNKRRGGAAAGSHLLITGSHPSLSQSLSMTQTGSASDSGTDLDPHPATIPSVGCRVDQGFPQELEPDATGSGTSTVIWWAPGTGSEGSGSRSNSAADGVNPSGAPGSWLPPRSLLRVHPSPKRFPACSSTDWRAAVVFMDERYVVINKPAGLPCMRHESNATEHVAACADRALFGGALSGVAGGSAEEVIRGWPEGGGGSNRQAEAGGGGSSGDQKQEREQLEACHRLDTWTTGLMVLARSKEANRNFKALLQAGDSHGLRAPGSGGLDGFLAGASAAGGVDPGRCSAYEVSSGADDALSPVAANGNGFGTESSGVQEDSAAGNVDQRGGFVSSATLATEQAPLSSCASHFPSCAAPPPPSSPRRSLYKVYKALTSRPVPLGRLEHYMHDGPFEGQQQQQQQQWQEGDAASPTLSSSTAGLPPATRDGDGAGPAGVLGEHSVLPGSAQLPPSLPVQPPLLPKARGPRLLSDHAHMGWKHCVLEVLDCCTVPEVERVQSWLNGGHATGGVLRSSSSKSGGRDGGIIRVAGPLRSSHTTGDMQESYRSPAAAGSTPPVGRQAFIDASRPAGLPPPSQEDGTCHQPAGQAPALAIQETQEPRYFQSRILLLTGRTHQIRAQLAAIGVPLVGDSMYAPVSELLVGASGEPGDEPRLAAVLREGEGPPQLDGRIGLHSAELGWGGRVLRVAAPWEGC